MKKLTASIIGLILCTSPVLASAKDTCCLSQNNLLNQIKNQVEGSVNKISLEELLNKFEGCITLPEIPETEKPENSTPSLPEEKPENTPNEETSFEIQVLNLVNIEIYTFSVNMVIITRTAPYGTIFIFQRFSENDLHQ